MISWGFYFFVLFVYRCALSIMAVTSLKNLGDSGIYHKGGRGDKGSLLELVNGVGSGVPQAYGIAGVAAQFQPLDLACQ